MKQRFGAIGKKGSIALIERLWKTLKDALGLRLLRPLAAEDLMEKIGLGLSHYAFFRPHQGLGGATPAEIYFGRTPSHLSAIPPPRGMPASIRWIHRFESSTSMRSGCRQFWFEKLPEGAVTRGKTSLDVYAHGGIVVAEALVCARQRPPQFPLHPYRGRHLPSNWLSGPAPTRCRADAVPVLPLIP